MRVERMQWDGRDPAGVARELRAARPDPAQVAAEAAEIIADVDRGGDDAVRELTRRLDGAEVRADGFRVELEHIEAAAASIDPEVREAMDAAAANIRATSEAELASAAPVEVELAQGQRVKVVAAPVGAAGVYAPGGRAAYPSSVLMCCIPARAAGVDRIAVASPPRPQGSVHRSVLAACAVAGVDEVYAVGGAQAIAALALGTESITPVDVIAGPGNRYVVEAKRQLSAVVGIDGLAGPTELVVVADGSVDPGWPALDLCAQAEHGTDGLLVMISPDRTVLDRAAALLPQLASERPSVTDAAVTLLDAAGVDEALALADALAPEHLQLQLAGADDAAAGDRVAGCVFVGPHAGAAFGDYAAGSNHVLPTGGTARFGGPLGPGTFLRRTSVVSIPAPAAATLARSVGVLAREEGFPVHGESAEARPGQNGGRP